ncbi:hypothetical protein BKA64DRAFT_404010 [Cadophora sp. MPI-SDFR-AT-0126]|nr:hypothetical protein BKA64DRAFT_404010 [Leotiomycetes sp. MPI-SDFR-AT-0126]
MGKDQHASFPTSTTERRNEPLSLDPTSATQAGSGQISPEKLSPGLPLGPATTSSCSLKPSRSVRSNSYLKPKAYMRFGSVEAKCIEVDSRPISQEQLAPEVKGIYTGLGLVEAKCIEVDSKQSIHNLLQRFILHNPIRNKT